MENSLVEDKVVMENNTDKVKSKKGENKNIKETSYKDKFVYMDDCFEILETAFDTGDNVILYGAGGHAKSDISLSFLQDKGFSPFIQTMGTGMTTDRLFGGMDIPTFQTTGKLEYLIQNSFMNHEYVIFEELFDAPDYILEQLKDILSSRIFRNGNQSFEIKTKLIICCTNKTREEFSKNSSLKALMERFPLELKVAWKDYNRTTYENLLKLKLGFSDPMLTYILEEFAKSGNTISPRIAVKAANILEKKGPDNLKYIADFATKPDILKSAISKFNAIAEVAQITNNIKKMSSDWTDIYNEYSTTSSNGDSKYYMKTLTAKNDEIGTELNKLKAIKADDDLTKYTAPNIKTYTEIHDKNKKTIRSIMAMELGSNTNDNIDSPF